MVEVFKTNVIHRMQALALIEQIHRTFTGYRANFDLDDCDRILRVASVTGSVETRRLIQLMEERGFKAEVLPDKAP
ncbi:MAG: hypothetical protein J0H74_35790 [Chitinophagaceae bacterium]|nr:hypothetical protein [Chitinophagaceae bacterium]